MNTNEGFYDWQARPAVEGGKPVLEAKTSFQAKRLSDSALTEIVEAVEAYYQAVPASIVRRSQPARS